MKRSLFVLALLLLLSLRFACCLAQQTQNDMPSYTLRLLMVRDTDPVQVMWTVDCADPNGVYLSLYSPSLLRRVNTLPKGALITYRSPLLGLPLIYGYIDRHGVRERILDDQETGQSKNVDAFGAYCTARGRPVYA